MFTGIIKTLGTVKKVEKRRGGGLRLVLHVTCYMLHEGGSIAVNGVCLTIAECYMLHVSCYMFHVMPETLKVTTLGSLKPGDRVNLEPALKYGDELGGHLVLGHVDGVGKIVAQKKRGNSVVLTISHPRELDKYIVHKGSVAVEGVSLTVMTHDSCSMKSRQGGIPPSFMYESQVAGHKKCPAILRGSIHVPCSMFHVSLTPYTLRHTTFGNKKVGDKVNLEVDVLARYGSS